MKKIIIILIACITLTYCSNTDEQDNPFGGELVGTVWLGTGDDEGESYSFLSNKDYKFVERGFIETGTYTFDGTNGTLINPDGTFSFKIDGITMTVEDGSSSVFIKN
ncbi:hypothetical protein MC378_12265 [Polaribacter sp. MSW13]|uniref:Uncharacterized protein n=1 Tax=Polaribacter marinus TaxID=2916838 RepID=A0A9X1VQE8_9FLAO|nr:hypothetical protein [Polaribacter marinus]MCI2229943.1 hypothetical protein [Polaribacter marinus]